MNTLAQGRTATTPRTGPPLGFRKQMIPPPQSMVAMICGKPNSGKTSFLASCPDALILNLDASSTPGCLEPKAMFWPGINSAGALVVPSGNSGDPDQGEEIVLTWEHVRSMVDTLINLAKTGQPRPAMVAIDSVTRAIDLARDYIVEHAPELKLSREAVSTFNELHGPAAWDATYTEITDLTKRLRQAGYGVYLIVHLGDKAVTNEAGATALLTDQPMITSSMQGRIYHVCEMIAKVQRKPTTVRRYVPVTSTTGEPIIDPKTNKQKTRPVDETAYCYTLTFRTTGHNDFTKTRRPLSDEIVFTEDGNQFSQFSEAYLAASKQEQSSNEQ